MEIIPLMKYFTFWINILNLFLRQGLVLKYLLFILIIYGGKVMSNENFVSYIQRNFGMTVKHILAFHYLFHYILPFYLLYRDYHYIHKFTLSVFLKGILIGLGYVYFMNAEKVYFIKRETLLFETFTIWAILYFVFS